jgi:hypothetical protein
MRHRTKGLLANRYRRDAFNYEPASRRKPPHISSYILTVLTIDTVHFDAPALRLALVFQVLGIDSAGGQSQSFTSQATFRDHSHIRLLVAC